MCFTGCARASVWPTVGLEAAEPAGGAGGPNHGLTTAERRLRRLREFKLGRSGSPDFQDAGYAGCGGACCAGAYGRWRAFCRMVLGCASFHRKRPRSRFRGLGVASLSTSVKNVAAWRRSGDSVGRS